MKEMSLIPSQPIFSSLISGCLKSNQFDRAWEVFDSMRLSYHQPDEVSFTLMLHACAKMQSSYGFSPDRITFNTLLMACARKKDLVQARRILDFMWQDTTSLLSPDHHTYTNLFWCYASYQPTAKTKVESQPKETTTALSTERHRLSMQAPTTRTQMIQEVHWLFKQMPQTVQRTSGLLNAYLAIHVSHKQPMSTCLKIYNKLFAQYKVNHDGFTFSHMLDYCYKTKEHDLAWKVWEDYQDFLEERSRLGHASTTLSEQKAIENEKHVLAIKEGWTDQQQQQLAVLMANTLGR
ncbi:hypothetical protein EDC96DRAFT_556025 [Choanephora cucurbitarum]|nr:hypothetical protein EDC96DRAFT_556025 [Choanephora cucurbitarum]